MDPRIAVLALALLGLTNGAPWLDIAFQHDAGSLYDLVFTGTGIPPNAKYVSIHYTVNGDSSSAKAFRASDNWELHLPKMAAGTYSITAFAIYREHTGAFAKTELAKLGTTLEQGNALATTHAQLPSRMIRSSVIFRDDFHDPSSLALSWDYEVSMYGGYNSEFQVYTKESKNVYVANDLLYLKPTYTADDSRFHNLYDGTMDMNALYGQCTVSGVDGCHRTGSGNNILPPIMSGKVLSKPSLKYGTVTVRAKIPQGDWIWPAIWMMPKSDAQYGAWPRSGEIDIMESRGNHGSYGVGKVSSTLHWGPDADHNQHKMTHGAQYTGNWHNDFHVWKMEWTPTHLVTYIDDKEILRVDPGSNFWSYGKLWSQGSNIWGSNKMAPFDQEFYMIFNVAVGGGFFNGGTNLWDIKEGQRASQKKFWEARSAWQNTWHGDDVALMIDWVEFKSLY